MRYKTAQRTMRFLPITTFFIITFAGVSYVFINKFSRYEHEDLINILDSYESVECPSGIALYKLRSKSHLYNVQTQGSMHNLRRTETSRFLKRCERTPINQTPGEGSFPSRGIQLSSAEFESLRNISFYHVLGVAAGYLLDEACADIDYDTVECASPVCTRLNPVIVYLSSSAVMSYLLEVVKGPDRSQVQEITKPDDWSFQTLTRGIFPGTLWCGFGNIAEDMLGHLGDHAETDDCCRSHDVCKPMIKAFETRYYCKNPSIVPVSHCGCDMEFYKCLQRANSPTSRMIGKIFFNLVKMKCFDFDMRDVCTSTLFGLCTETKRKCVAVLKSNKNFPVYVLFFVTNQCKQAPSINSFAARQLSSAT